MCESGPRSLEIYKQMAYKAGCGAQWSLTRPIAPPPPKPTGTAQPGENFWAMGAPHLLVIWYAFFIIKARFSCGCCSLVLSLLDTTEWAPIAQRIPGVSRCGVCVSLQLTAGVFLETGLGGHPRHCTQLCLSRLGLFAYVRV